MARILSLRTFLGALVFMILVGEFQAAQIDKTFTPIGFITLYSLYFVTFILYEAITQRYNLVNYQIFLLGFALYAVLITGLFHGEIQNYVTQPHNDLITTIIRIQSSLYAFFGYILLNRFLPDKESNKKISMKVAGSIFILYFILLTPTKTIGFITLLSTYLIAPVEAIVYTILGIIALKFVLAKAEPAKTAYKSKFIFYSSAILFVIGLIPLFALSLPYYVLMIIITACLLLNKNFRLSPVVR